MKEQMFISILCIHDRFEVFVWENCPILEADVYKLKEHILMK